MVRMMSIPRIIHQIYLPGWDALPEETKASIEALRSRNPDWHYRFYDEAEVLDYINCHYRIEMLATYNRIDPSYYAARADLFRYLVCYKEGGVYLDIKSTALRPLNQVLLDSDQFLLSQWPGRRELPAGAGFHPELSQIAGDEYIQWFIACEPGHPFLKAVIDAVVENVNSYRFWRDYVGRRAVWRLSGPVAYTLAIHPLLDLHPHRVVRFESDLDFVYSIHAGGQDHQSAYGTHYWNVSRPVIRTNQLETLVCEFSMGWLRWKLHGAGKRLGVVREPRKGFSQS